MSNKEFFKKFQNLSDTWVPKLELQLSSTSDLRTEIQSVTAHASFTIDYNHSSRELGGRHSCNCNNRSEVTSISKDIISTSINGTRKSVCEILFRELSNNSLFSSVHKNKLPIQTFEHSCLVTCTTCSGSGNVRCSNCSGSGKVTQWRNEIVGYDEYRDSRGYVTRREPRYENRSYRVSCGPCGGTGRVRCSTCHGDGQNTYIETVDIFSRVSEFSHKWTTFEEAVWVNNYLEGNQKNFPLQDAGRWDLSDQSVVDLDNGDFHVKLPGAVIAADCDTTMSSSYTSTTGLLKTLGGLVYDCDYIYADHVYTAANQAVSQNKLEAKSISPLTSSKMFNVCGESTDGGKTITSCELITRNMITSEASKEMNHLLGALKEKISTARSQLSVASITLRTLFMYAFISLLLMASSIVLGNAIYENFSFMSLIAQLSNLAMSLSVSPWYLTQISTFAIVLFVPSILIMYLFGAKKNWTTKRILKWYWLCTPLLIALVSIFMQTPVKRVFNTEVWLTAGSLPFIEILLFALLGGILLSRKKSWGVQEKQAELYGSDVIMKKLDYKE